jgi:hypothetical protein
MPYAKPRITRPLPRPTVRVPWRRAVKMVGTGTPLAGLLGPYESVGRVYVAWDPPSAANPAWIEVTGFVQFDPGIEITHGRPDGESDPQVSTATMTVDNTDGRWSPTNPNGAWFGQIRKGCWLRVDVLPPSGVVSTRFVGFVQQLPVSWSGRYSLVEISASDRFVLLGNAPPYQTAITHEWLNDPVGAQYIAGYWPLHEPSASTYVSDVSGNAPVSQATLAVYSQGVSAGANVAFSNTTAPGYDGISTVAFTPTGTPILSLFGGTGGALPNGSYLRGNIGPMGNVAQITVWVNTTVASQPVWSWTDPASNYSIGLMIDSQGFVQVFQGALSGTSSVIEITGSGQINRYPVNDGIWHQISIKLQTPVATSLGYGFIGLAVDGTSTWGNFYIGTLATTIAPQATVTRFTLGGAEGWINNGVSGTALFTGSLSDLVVHLLPSSTLNVDWYGAYIAGTSMWQSPGAAYSVGESCGRRVVRLAQYAGVPAPTRAFVLPNTGVFSSDVTPGVTPFINIPAETAHLAGQQQLQGTEPLTAMQTAAHTENMPLFVDRQGRITLQPSTLRQNPNVAFTINALDLDPSTKFADDFQYLQNQTVITPSGQGSLTVNTNGLTSQAAIGLYSNGLNTVTITPLESGSLGAAVNAAGANPPPRHNPLACEVATLATQTYTVPVPAAIATSAAGWPLNLVQTAGAYYGTQAYQSVIPAGAAASQDSLDITVNATATTTYAFSAYVAIPAGTQSASLRIVINWINASSGLISSSFGTITAINAGSSALTQLTVTGTAPTGTVTATLRLELMTSPTSTVTVEASGLQWQTGALTAWQIPGGSSPNLLTVDQATAGQGTPYTGAPAYGPSWYDLVLAADISTVVGVVNWPTQSPGGASGSYYIEGWTETITAGNHLFAWNTSPVQGPTFQLDSTTLGLLDSTSVTLAY